LLSTFLFCVVGVHLRLICLHTYRLMVLTKLTDGCLLRTLIASTARPTASSTIQDLDLYVAAALGQVDEVSRLVSDGRDPVSGLDGDTPLHAASGNGHGGVVAVLLNAGVHPDLRIAGACALSPFLPFSLSSFFLCSCCS
jgi:ankyrin repeat protein